MPLSTTRKRSFKYSSGSSVIITLMWTDFKYSTALFMIIWLNHCWLSRSACLDQCQSHLMLHMMNSNNCRRQVHAPNRNPAVRSLKQIALVCFASLGSSFYGMPSCRDRRRRARICSSSLQLPFLWLMRVAELFLDATWIAAQVLQIDSD